MVAALLFTMSYQQQKTPDLNDELADWYKSVGKDGTVRYYTRMREDHLKDIGFKNKSVDACNNNLQAGETQTTWDYKGEKFGLSQMDNGAVTIWRGGSPFPSNKPITLPPKWGQQTFSGGKGGGYQKKPFTPAKVVVQGAIKNPQWLPLKDAIELCKNTENLFLYPSTQGFDDDLGTTCVYVGEAPVV